MLTQSIENKLSYQIIGAAIEVYQTLGGPGLLESIYESALCHELSLMGLNFVKKLPINVSIRDPLCVDILVENKVIIEVKATEKEHDIYYSQLLTYLRLSEKKLGLLINFGQNRVKDGIHRVVNGL